MAQDNWRLVERNIWAKDTVKRGVKVRAQVRRKGNLFEPCGILATKQNAPIDHEAAEVMIDLEEAKCEAEVLAGRLLDDHARKVSGGFNAATA